jgi:GntR family transcriptional regulator
MRIDRDSPLPLYYQLKKLLLAKIESGVLKPGDILFTESQMQEQYDVSRTTVRQALKELEDAGKIVRQRGRGTFVAKPKVSHSPEQYPDLADHMVKQGLTPGWSLLGASWVIPPEDIAKQLNLAAGHKAFCLRRLRLENDDPIGYHVAYVSPNFATAIDETAFLDGGSLRYLREQNILETSIANRILEAVPASMEDAAVLNCSKGDALLQIRRIVLSADNLPIEIFRGVYLGSRFQYHINNMRAINPINA